MAQKETQGRKQSGETTQGVLMSPQVCYRWRKREKGEMKERGRPYGGTGTTDGVQNAG